MFERFTREARQVVVEAQEEARHRAADEIRTEHLLAAIYSVRDEVALAVLDELGVDEADALQAVAGLRPGPSPSLDAEALSAIGIDLDEVRRQVEEAFGPGALDRTRAAHGGRSPRLFGHIPFEGQAKKALELALREAIHLRHDQIGAAHILLGLIHTEGGAAHHVLAERGVRLEAARAVVERLVRSRKAG
ncbi:Clp protease N-terminal domain-containing protein [Pseudonocardia zijingensis]|uniref:Clp protease N-terminal domain-containing protein n=1 Tax=Pseudonocardia zijingensis TaxID=153376 RepID=A0ABN1PT78_9PSEU